MVLGYPHTIESEFFEEIGDPEVVVVDLLDGIVAVRPVKQQERRELHRTGLDRSIHVSHLSTVAPL
ncbi:hypothetical protein ACLBYD_25630 [Rhodococcus sp. C26F]